MEQKPTKRTATHTQSNGRRSTASQQNSVRANATHTARANASRTTTASRAGAPRAGATRVGVTHARTNATQTTAEHAGVKRTNASQTRASATQARSTASQTRASATQARASHASVAKTNNAQARTVRAAASASGAGTLAKTQRGKSSHAKRKVALIVVAFLLIFLLADHIMNFNKAYAGVHIGTVDCSGKTESEIVALLDETYGQSYQQREVLVYASEDARSYVESTGETELGNEERISAEESQEQHLVWSVYPETVSASFDEQASAKRAVEEAHGISNIFNRIAIAFQGIQIDPVFTFGDAYQTFANEVNATVGVERIDYNIAVTDGVCEVTSGQDGILMDDATFQKQLIAGFMSSDDAAYSFVATPVSAPVRITQDAAQLVCDQVNVAIANGVNFMYEDAAWNATASAVGQWVASKVEQNEAGWQLVPFINADVARTDLLSHIKENGGEEPMQVTFSVSSDNSVVVHTDSSGTIPLVDEALTQLNVALFGIGETSGQDAALAEEGQVVSVSIASTTAPSEMSFDDALYYGVVGEISSYTTSYSYGTSSTEARNFNIHLAADLLNNSICASGGQWSFHETAGECNEENGFQEAGVIEEGVYSTAFGGGICQVATTVFNAVYEGGYYVDRRHNHTIYDSSYPAGRDAAVSWPDLDLIWSNDTASDILLTTSYTDGTLTVTLWGVSPERSVETYVSNWEEGEEYETKYVLNTDMAPTAYRVKTRGSNGRSIYVERTVYDKNGEQVSLQRFSSTYDAVNEIIEHGEDYEVPDDDEKE